MKFLVVCDFRENFKNHTPNHKTKIYNDHPTQNNIYEIINSIKSLGYECEYFGGIPELIHAIDCNLKFDDCIFLNFTDEMDENYSRVQAPALLDILEVPYSGSGVFASVLMNNKHFCKQALINASINMPKSCIVNSILPLNEEYIKGWNFPLFIKPNCEGSSLGIAHRNVCHTMNDIKNICDELISQFGEVIIEEYVYGLDVTNYLIGNKDCYLVNEVISAELFDTSPYAIYGIEEKQNKMRKLYFNEEYLSNNMVDSIKKESAKIANIIGALDICRIDYRVNLKTNEINFIEINSAPRFSSTSEIGFIANKYGITFSEMMAYYINTVLRRIF